MEIDFLSEAPRGHGFAFTGVVSVLLTFLLHAVVGKISGDILMDRGLSTDQIPLFDELYNFSLELSNCISQGKNIGNANNYTTMLPDNPLPIVYFSANKPPSPVDVVIRKDTLPVFLGMDSATIQELPLDYGVIFTGMEYIFSDMESMRARAMHEQNRLDSFTENIIRSLLTQDVAIYDHRFDQERTQLDIDNTNLRILE